MLAKHTLILALGVICWGAAHLDRLMLLVPRGPHQVLPIEWLLPASTADPESLLALGYPLSLHCVDLFSLELISGVSDKTGMALIQNKDEILRSISSGIPITKALQSTRGVGPAFATKLAHYLDGIAPCTVSSTFNMTDSRVP